MLRTLIGINFRSLFSGSNRGGKSKKRSVIGTAAMGLLLLYAIGAVGAAIGMLFFSVFEVFSSLDIEWFNFAIAGILSFCICFVFSIFAAKTQLFEAGDNELLLAMPVKPITILISRILSLLLLNYIYSAVVMIPALAVWIMLGEVTAIRVVCYVLVFLTLPLLSLTLSCFFGWILAIVAAKMRNKNIITTVFSIAFLILYLVVYSQIGNYITALIANGETIAYSIQRTVLPAYLMGDAIANGNLLSLLLFLIIAVVPFALMLLLLSRSFISIATSNRGMIKSVYREKRLKSSGTGIALFKKELDRFISCPIYIMNSSLGTIFIIILSVFIIFKQATLNEMLTIFGAFNISTPIAAAVLIMLCAAMNFISAPSISLEGKSLWIVQTLPISPRTVLLSKVMPHFVITETSILAGATVFGILLRPSAVELLIMYLLPTVFNVFTALAGVVINLYFPKFDWINETQAVKQGFAVLLAMMINILAVILPVFGYIYLAADIISTTAFAFLYMAFLLIIAIVLYFYLCSRGCKRFERL